MKNFTKSILFLAAGLMMAANVWGDAFDPSSNIAQGKTAKAGWSRRGDCPSKNNGEIPDKAIDGSKTSHWISWDCNNAARAWIAVDLGESYRLREFVLVWNNDAGRVPSRFLIQVATDTPSDFVDDVEYSNTGWETIADISETQTYGESGNRYALGAFSGRYVRIVSLNKNVLGLSEFEIYADAPASSPEVIPTLESSAMYSDLVAGSTTLSLTATDHNGNALHTFLVQDQMGKYYRVTTDGSDHVTISGLDNRRYAFTVWAIEEGCASASSMSVIVGASTFNTETNLALNQPAYAVRYQGNSDRTAEKANDGSLSNLWNAGSDSGEPIAEADRGNVWWYVDLQDQYELKYISLYWSQAYANSFIVQIRKNAPSSLDMNDDSAWETFLDYSGNQTYGTDEANSNLYGDVTGAKAAFSNTPKGRYVRFRAKGANNWSWGVHIREIRVYGSGYLPLDNIVPVISSASYNDVTADYTGVKFNITASDNITSADNLVYTVKDQNEVMHDAVYSDGVITVTDMPTGKNVTVTIYAEDEAGNHSAGYEVAISYLRPDKNLAENKTSYGCYTYQESQNASKANDGKTNTNWTTYTYTEHGGSTSNEWWYVDLGDYYDIRRIEVVWVSGHSSTNYSIQYRQNAPAGDSGASEEEWHSISEFSGLSGNQSIDISSTKAQFICMRSSAREDGGQLQLAELRVFGKAYAITDSEAPVISAASYNGVSADWTELKFNITVSDNVTANEDLVYVVEDPEGEEHAATYSAGVISVTGMPTFKEGDFTIYATDAVDNKSVGYVVENVSYVDPTENLAYHKVAYACVHINDGEGKLMPVDGNVNTSWTSYSHTHHDNDWWYVDLGDFYDIRRIEVVWQENRHSTDFSIQYRQNAPEGDSGATEEEWETKYSNLSGDQELDGITSMQARYICMRSKDYVHEQDHAQVRMAEFRVYGKAFASIDANPPVITTAYVHYNDDGKAYLHLEATDLEDGAVNRFRVTNTNTSTTEVLMTNEDDEIIIDGLTIGTTYTFQIQALDNVDNASDVTELKVNVPAPTSTNIAPFGTPSAGYEKSGEGAGNGNDGNTETPWVTYGAAGQPENWWWQVELDGVYHLKKIAILWDNNNYATAYTIQTKVSESDEWTSLPQISADAGGLKEINLEEENITAGFVKVILNTQRYDFSRVYEVMVYADAKMINFEDNGSNSDLIEEYNDHEVIAVINRDILANNTWYTLCLPFDMSAEKVSEVFGASTIATLVSSEDRGSLIHLNFNYVDAIQAGKPYLIKPGTSFTAGTTISNVTIKNVDPSAEGYKAIATHMHFQGTFDKIMLQGEDKRYVSANNELYSPKPDGGSKIGAFRCFFTIPDGSSASAPGKQARIVFGPQNATGIDLINDSSKTNGKLLINGVLYIIRDGNTYNAQGMLVK